MNQHSDDTWIQRVDEQWALWCHRELHDRDRKLLQELRKVVPGYSQPQMH